MTSLRAQDLIDRYLGGDISDEERLELEQLLRASPEARVLFWEVCGTHAALKEWGKAHWGRMATQGQPSRNRWRLVTWLGLADSEMAPRLAALCLAGCIAIGLFMARGSLPPKAYRPSLPESAAMTPPPQAFAPVAWLSAARGAVWAHDHPLPVGSAITPGPLRLRAGLAELRFASGATVALNGAVELEIVNATRVFLRSGSITPFVPPRAHGFTVVSPSGEVVDLGTEFAVRVDADGKTSVYVIDGEVDVASGHSRRGSPLRMTQGFAAQLLSPADTKPNMSQVPIVIDHFEDGESRTSAAGTGLRWIDLDAHRPARVESGSLMLPIDNVTGTKDLMTRILLDHDFSQLVGRCSTITFKATLPPIGSAGRARWLALVIDSDSAASSKPRVPPAYSSDAAAAVMVSPDWQASLRIRGVPVEVPRIFAREADAVGPYQILVTIDDSPAGHRQDGGCTISLMVNGGEVVHRQRFDLGLFPRLGFHTFLPLISGGQQAPPGRGSALIDDLSVSVEVTEAT